MQCSVCKAENPAQNRFCGSCGNGLEDAAAFCPGCGARLAPEARFCGTCGIEAAAGAGAAMPSLAPNLVTPKHIADSILSARHEIEGERKYLTVLFADIEASTTLIQGLDPEQALARLDPTLKQMIDCVHRFEGTVNKVQGDGIMALFGAPLAHEDHAARACYAALAIQEVLGRERDEGIAVRIGLHTGEVFVRSIGNDLWMEYDAVGPTVHLARRLEELAEPGSVLISDDVRRAAEGFVKTTPLGSLSVRGVDAPIDVSRLLPSVLARSRWESRLQRGLSRFVGRDHQLAQLDAVVAEARDGVPCLVSISGEPGVGKSRLAHELITSDSVEGFLVLSVDVLPYPVSAPYQPIAAMLRQCVGIADQDDDDAVKRKLEARLKGLDAALLGHLPGLLSVLDVRPDDAQWHELDPVSRRSRTLEAVVAYALRGAGELPVLLLLEDVQWADSETLAVVGAMADAMTDQRLLLLTTCRAEFSPPWQDHPHNQALRVEAFDDSVAQQMLEALVEPDPRFARFAARVIERAGGTPLFIEEILRALAETGGLQHSGGRYRMGPGVDELQLPATVQDVIASRIDRLPANGKRILQSAAVIGKQVPVALLAETTGVQPAALEPLLRSLQDAGLLLRASLPPRDEVRFNHAFTLEVAYRNPSRPWRTQAHRRVLAAMQRLYGERLNEHVGALAHHAVQAGVWDQASRFLVQAAHKAMDRSVFAEARSLLERAQDVVDRHGSGDHDLELAIDIRLALRNVYNAVGEYGRIADCLDMAEELARRVGNSAKLSAILTTKTQLLCVKGSVQAAMEAGQAACKAAELAGDMPALVGAASVLGWAYQLHGAYPDAVAVMDGHVAFIKQALRHVRVGTGTMSVFCLGTLAQAKAYAGQFAEAKACADEAVAIADEVARPYDLGMGLYAQGDVLLAKGDVAAALATFERGRAVALENRMDGLLPWYLGSLGAARLAHGQAEQALPLLQESIERGQAMGISFAAGRAHAHLGQARARLGEVGQAMAAVEQAMAMARRHDYRGIEVLALRSQAEALLAGGEPGQAQIAQAALDEALAIAGSYGMRPETALCQLLRGRLLRLGGELAAAEEAEGTAAGLLQEMQSAFSLDAAATASAAAA